MDTTSRPSSPEHCADLWSSILDSVSSSRATPAKQILLLGEPSSGKSGIAAALLRKPSLAEGGAVPAAAAATHGDFALGYEFSDVRDDADEDTLARLSVYTVPSSDKAYTALLPHFLPPRLVLSSTLVIITLDWTRPWTFVEQLETWLTWVDEWAKGDGSRESEIVREECRERLQAHLQHYTEPSSDPLPTSNSALSTTILPLSPGSFTHNAAGVPIIVACTKADLIDEGNDVVAGASGMGSMVKGKGGEWEERTDGVMQVLRTICLKYGAALFYTTPVPSTLQVLRQYALHLLFMPPAALPGMASSGEVQGVPAAVRKAFPFTHRPNTLDRDRIVVPAGWDSWGKIAVLRDGFDAKMWGEAWERDLEGVPGGGGEMMSAKKAYASLVPDQGTKPHPLPPFNNPTPEQAFLAKNYDENAKKTDRDPRGAFRNPQDFAGAGAAGIVGPLGSSSFSLPNVERALSEMEAGVGVSGGGAGAGAGATRLGAGRQATGAGGRPGSLSMLGAPATPTGMAGRSPVSPASGGGAGQSPGGGQSQHEVLQNFFQSLLSTKDRGAGGAARGGTGKVNGTTTTTGGGGGGGEEGGA